MEMEDVNNVVVLVAKVMDQQNMTANTVMVTVVVRIVGVKANYSN